MSWPLAGATKAEPNKVSHSSEPEVAPGKRFALFKQKGARSFSAKIVMPDGYREIFETDTQQESLAIGRGLGRVRTLYRERNLPLPLARGAVNGVSPYKIKVRAEMGLPPTATVEELKAARAAKSGKSLGAGQKPPGMSANQIKRRERLGLPPTATYEEVQRAGRAAVRRSINAELEATFEAAEALLWDLKVEDIEIVKQLRLMVTTARARRPDPAPIVPKLIKGDAEHALALAEVDRLMQLTPVDGDRLELFAALIVMYEKVRFPIEEPTAEEAAAFRAEQERRR